MTQFTIRQPARPNSRFLSDAFDHQLGKEIDINMPNGDKFRARLRFVNVADDGSFADLGFEGDIPNISEIINRHYSYRENLPSFGFRKDTP